MSRKIIVLILLVMGSFSAVFATTEAANEATLKVQAYKLGDDDYLNIAITSAVSGKLTELVWSDSESALPAIDITDKIDSLSKPITETSSDLMNEQVIFSYRVFGHSIGTFTISLDFSPFEHNGGGNSVSAVYAITNTNYIFNNTGNYQDKNSSFTIEEKYTKGKGTTSLEAQWYVDGTGAIVPDWIVRGGVAASISGYESASYGSHTATVHVTLTSEN